MNWNTICIARLNVSNSKVRILAVCTFWIRCTVWEFQDFLQLWFYVKSILVVLKPQKTAILTISIDPNSQCLGIFYIFKCEIPKRSKFKAFLICWNQPKLITRKIRVAWKSLISTHCISNTDQIRILEQKKKCSFWIFSKALNTSFHSFETRNVKNPATKRPTTFHSQPALNNLYLTSCKHIFEKVANKTSILKKFVYLKSHSMSHDSNTR